MMLKKLLFCGLLLSQTNLMAMGRFSAPAPEPTGQNMIQKDPRLQRGAGLKRLDKIRQRLQNVTNRVKSSGGPQESQYPLNQSGIPNHQAVSPQYHQQPNSSRFNHGGQSYQNRIQGMNPTNSRRPVQAHSTNPFGVSEPVSSSQRGNSEQNYAYQQNSQNASHSMGSVHRSSADHSIQNHARPHQTHNSIQHANHPGNQSHGLVQHASNHQAQHERKSSQHVSPARSGIKPDPAPAEMVSLLENCMKVGPYLDAEGDRGEKARDLYARHCFGLLHKIAINQKLDAFYPFQGKYLESQGRHVEANPYFTMHYQLFPKNHDANMNFVRNLLYMEQPTLAENMLGFYEDQTRYEARESQEIEDIAKLRDEILAHTKRLSKR